MTYLGGIIALIVSFLLVSHHLYIPLIRRISERLGSLLLFTLLGSRNLVSSPGFDYYINYLELKAIYNGLLALLPHVNNCAVKIMSDNICAVFYINLLGGKHSPPNVPPHIIHLEYLYSIQHHMSCLVLTWLQKL